MKLKKHVPWIFFALVLSLSLTALETHGVDTKARQTAEITEIKTAWVEKQTKTMDLGQLGQLSKLQRALETTRDPGSVKKLN
jgi:hypothetical protein